MVEVVGHLLMLGSACLLFFLAGVIVMVAIKSPDCLHGTVRDVP